MGGPGPDRPASTGPAAGPIADGRLGPGAMAAAEFSPPMLAVSAAGSAGGPLGGRPGEWLLEPKLDGLRCIAVRNGGTVTLWSRNRLSFNARFPTVVNSLGTLPASNFVLDGEIVGLRGGRPDFGALQGGIAETLEFWVFDMPWLLGHDLRHLPLEERKSLLAETVRSHPGLNVVECLQGDPRLLLERMCREGWEGLVGKRAGSPYREGRSGDWYKLKCACRQEFVIGGYTQPGGTRTAFGALLLGYWSAGELSYAGKVGTGFSQAVLAQVLAQLVPLDRSSCPFAVRVAERAARWVEPVLVAEVAFSNWTIEGRLRHPSFLGLRPDKASHDVVREECGPRPEERR